MLKENLINKINEYINKYRNKNVLNINVGEDYNVSFLAQGEYNINFILESNLNKNVFRVNTGSQLELKNQIKYEYCALKSLEVSGVTPKVYYVDDTKNYFDYGILIMEFLEGRPLEYNKDLKKAGKIFSKIHSIDLNKINNDNFIVESNIFTERVKEAERLLDKFWDSSIVNIELKRYFDRFLNWAIKNKAKEKYFIENKWHVINNTEVNSHNFIIGDNGNYLIDWEKPVISDPCQDLTQFLAPTTTLWRADYLLSKEEEESFFKEYIDGLGGEDRNIRDRVYMYNPYLYLRALSWCAYAYIEYHDPNKEIKNMDTFNKVKEYLQIDFMDDLLKDYLV
ncbi:MAG TPA: phosphotransferase [Tissierellales bacterium]|nr:phosphotransferase [Tissierellales bacterium]